MKRLFLIIGMILIFATSAFGAVGTVTITEDKIVIEGKHSKKIITLTCVGGTGAETGTVPNVVLPANIVKGWYPMGAETTPGLTAPDNNYDIVINDAAGVDIAGSLLMNRSSTVPQLVNLGMSPYAFLPVTGALTIVHSNQTAASATWTLILTFVSE